jgi:hypothetical protein
MTGTFTPLYVYLKPKISLLVIVFVEINKMDSRVKLSISILYYIYFSFNVTSLLV